MTSGIIGLVGLVLGYYFGSRGVEKAELEALEGASSAVGASESASHVVDELREIQLRARAQTALLDALREDPAVRQKVDEMAERIRGR